MTITNKDIYNFATGNKRASNIIEAIEIFEMITSEFLETYENKNAITKIETIER